MKKIKMVDGSQGAGCEAGSIVEVSDERAERWIAKGIAVPAGRRKKAEAKPEKPEPKPASALTSADLKGTADTKEAK